jgi:non-specific serine/threonine protein kinase
VAQKTGLLDDLGILIDHSLVTREIGFDGEPRFRMLETIREFGLNELHVEEEEGLRTAHANFFLNLAWQLRPMANTRATHAPLDQFAADEDNMRAALGWLDAHGEPADFVRMVVACYTFLFARSHFREAATQLERALVKSSQAHDADRARLLIGTAELAMVKGQLSQAVASFAEILPFVRDSGDTLDLIMALISSGAALNYAGRYGEGAAQLNEALSIAEGIEDEVLRAAVSTRALANLSSSARGQGDFVAATAYGEKALRGCHLHALDLAETRILADLGDIAKDQGDYGLAASRYLASLEQTSEHGELRSIAEVLGGMASIATAWGHYREALLLRGAATALRERLGFGMQLPLDAAGFDRDHTALHSSLGEQEVAAIVAEGRSLPLADCLSVAAALAAPARAQTGSGTAARDVLTSREREVLRLLAKSHTDREIAEALSISTRTVNWHVSTILGKLGAASRRDAVSLARDAALL